MKPNYLRFTIDQIIDVLQSLGLHPVEDVEKDLPKCPVTSEIGLKPIKVGERNFTFCERRVFHFCDVDHTIGAKVRFCEDDNLLGEDETASGERITVEILWLRGDEVDYARILFLSFISTSEGFIASGQLGVRTALCGLLDELCVRSAAAIRILHSFKDVAPLSPSS